MAAAGRRKLKGWAQIGTLMMVSVLGNSVGSVLLGRGMKDLPLPQTMSGSAALGLLPKLAFNPYLLVGVLCLLVFGACYFTLLSWEDLSFVLPATAFSYVLVALLAFWFLGETIPEGRWLGTGLVAFGVFLVTSSRRPG